MSRTKWFIALAAGAVLVASLFVSGSFTVKATHAAATEPCPIVPEQTGYWDKTQNSPIIMLQNALYAASLNGGLDNGTPFPFDPSSISSPDGIYGKNTMRAVMDFQNKQNLKMDGSVGTNTWNALNNFYPLNCQP